MHYPRIRGLAASAGVRLRANETEISAAPWALRLGKGLYFTFTGYLLVHRRGHIVYYVVEFKTIFLTLNKFSFINLIKLDHH